MIAMSFNMKKKSRRASRKWWTWIGPEVPYLSSNKETNILYILWNFIFVDNSY